MGGTRSGARPRSARSLRVPPGGARAPSGAAPRSGGPAAPASPRPGRCSCLRTRVWPRAAGILLAVLALALPGVSSHADTAAPEIVTRYSPLHPLESEKVTITVDVTSPAQ